MGSYKGRMLKVEEVWCVLTILMGLPWTGKGLGLESGGRSSREKGSEVESGAALGVGSGSRRRSVWGPEELVRRRKVEESRPRKSAESVRRRA